jgi:hypothetical protein
MAAVIYLVRAFSQLAARDGVELKTEEVSNRREESSHDVSLNYGGTIVSCRAPLHSPLFLIFSECLTNLPRVLGPCKKRSRQLIRNFKTPYEAINNPPENNCDVLS